MEDDPIEVRMGTFFVVIGIGAFILFVVSDIAKKADFDYLFMAMLLIGVGMFFRRKKKPPPSADRFSYVRKMRHGSKNRGKGKDKDKKEDKK